MSSQGSSTPLQKGIPEASFMAFSEALAVSWKGKSIELTESMAPYRNQGGFDLLGSGRTKIDKPEQFAVAAEG